MKGFITTAAVAAALIAAPAASAHPLNMPLRAGHRAIAHFVRQVGAGVTTGGGVVSAGARHCISVKHDVGCIGIWNFANGSQCSEIFVAYYSGYGSQISVLADKKSLKCA